MRKQRLGCDRKLTSESRLRVKSQAAAVVSVQPVRAQSTRGFTLIEILLTIALIVVLVGVVSVGVLDDVEQRYLDHGADQMESLLRMARADAANQGRRFRLNVDQETGELVVEWEPQPLAQPGEFSVYREKAWSKALPNELVRVVRCQRTGASALNTLVFNSQESGEDSDVLIEPIEFQPDGSSDSALIEVVSSSTKDQRHAMIELDGVNQTISVQVLSESELAAFYDAREIEPVSNDRAY